MSNLSITAAQVALVQKGDVFLTGPATEAITAGQAIGINTSSGKLELRNATSAAESKVFGVAVTSASAAGAVTSLAGRGSIISLGNALSAMSYGAPIYLSATDGTLADANPIRGAVHTLEFSGGGTPTGGTMTITLDTGDGQGALTTGALNYNDSAATIGAAVAALGNIDADDMTWAGGAAPTAVTCTLKKTMLGKHVTFTVVTSSLTTGGAAAVGTFLATTGAYSGVVVGRVIPAFGATTADKLMLVTTPNSFEGE